MARSCPGTVRRMLSSNASSRVAWSSMATPLLTTGRGTLHSFLANPMSGRGISAQTTPQMLVRFQQDVIDLHPAVVVILAGITDIAGNTGPSTLEMIQDNLRSMVERAHASGIRVVLCSLLPAVDFPWNKGTQPAPKVQALNAWIAAYCASNHVVFVNYYPAMANAKGP